jgi:hypothetical protein
MLEIVGSDGDSQRWSARAREIVDRYPLDDDMIAVLLREGDVCFRFVRAGFSDDDADAENGDFGMRVGVRADDVARCDRIVGRLADFMASVVDGGPTARSDSFQHRFLMRPESPRGDFESKSLVPGYAFVEFGARVSRPGRNRFRQTVPAVPDDLQAVGSYRLICAGSATVLAAHLMPAPCS